MNYVGQTVAGSLSAVANARSLNVKYIRETSSDIEVDERRGHPVVDH